MRTKLLALALVYPFLPSIAAAEDQFSEPEDKPRIIKFVGDATPADQRPRSSYLVIDHTTLPPAPDVIEHGGAPTIFYINKNGGTYQPGNNDARTNRSSIIDQTSTIDPWAVSATGWNQVKSCMVEMFSRWNVTVTDIDPGNTTPHFEIVIAGSPQDIGMQSGVGGVSPFTSNCSVINNSIVYTFAEVYGTQYRDICETAAQEIAHSFGLDHEYLCEDPMTYLYNCGDKSFQNVAAQCGEYSARACQCNGNTQNSVAMLDARLGLAGTTPTPPTVAFTAPLNGAAVAPGFAISVMAADTDGTIANVQLRIDGTLIATDSTAPYTFTAPANLTNGNHSLEARAQDDDATTGTATISVTVNSTNPPPPDAGVPDAGPGPVTPDAGPDGPGPGDPDAGPGGPGAGGDDDDDGSDDGYVAGGCSSGAGGGIGGALVLALVVGWLSRRRSRAA